MDSLENRTKIAGWFSGLAINSSDWKITSPIDAKYNCIAWAAGDHTKWWWPGEHSFWPEEVALNDSIASFVAMFSMQGYEQCEIHEVQLQDQCVAIYAIDGLVKHAAIKKSSAKSWSSKLGTGWDIDHQLDGVEGEDYGTVACVMRKAN